MTSPRKRIFAWIMSLVSDPYERIARARKRSLLGDLTGTVVEIGPGTGANVRFIRESARWIGVEPNPHMGPYLRDEVEKRNRTYSLVRGTAAALPFPDSSVDAVVSTLVLCSVGPQLGEALSEIQRVLKPGGRFLFLEHVAAPGGSLLRRIQEWIRPVWMRIADGCRPDQETGRAIEDAGFSRVEMDRFRLRVPLVGPHVAGVAWK